MGRKGGNKRKFKNNGQKDGGSDPRKQFKGNQSDLYARGYTDWEYNHPIFETYYRTLFENSYFKDDVSEFEEFWDSMKEKLPVVFRINKLVPNYQAFQTRLKSDNIIKSFLQDRKQPFHDDSEEQQEEKADSAIEVEGTTGGDNKNEQTEGESEQKRGERFEFSDEEIENLRVRKIEFYPDELVWEVNCNRAQLKKSHRLKEFHRYLQRATDSGLISRQELVSMLPPLLLDVQPHHLVFDMCAAPGSKTAQLLEMLYGQGGAKTSGAIVANDVDQKRAYLLTHQVGRLNPSGLAVINHPAQFFPSLMNPASTEQYDKKFYFDRVQADVPCSGDGATRKIPTQWRNWNTRDAQVLHPLQLAILQRALTLCKVGGYVVFSTCSINPIEDESVLTEAFRRATAGSIELIDIHDKLPGLKGRRGLFTWPVASCPAKANSQVHLYFAFEKWTLTTECLKFFTKIEDVDRNDRQNQFIKATMFPESEEIMRECVKIQNSMRILPHDQNTGGFFIALIKKNSTIVWDRKSQQLAQPIESFKNKSHSTDANNGEEVSAVLQHTHNEEDDMPDASEIPEEAHALQNQGEEKEDQQNQNDQKKGNHKEQAKEVFRQISHEDWENIMENYDIEGLTEFNLVTNVSGKQSIIRLISEGVKQFIDCDTKGIVNIVNMGTRVFERQRETFQGLQCRFRLCQDAVHLIGPLMRKRKVEVSKDQFLHFLANQNVKHAEIKNEELKKQLIELGSGSIVLYCPHFNDYVVCQNSHQSFGLMVNKETQESLKIRYP